MTKQHQAAQAKPERKSQTQVKLPAVEELLDDLIAMTKLPAGPLATTNDGNVEAHAGRLGDPRLQTAQRQAIAAQIGQVSGNRHLQRVVSLAQGDKAVNSPTCQRQQIDTQKEQQLEIQIALPETRRAESTQYSGDNYIQRRKIEYFVVGDPGLNAGNGIFLRRLEQIKPRLMRLRNRGNWTLVISIHGAENYIANRVRALRGGPGSYDADALNNIFSNDPDFVQWRNQWGPNRIVLNACQVGANLESAIISAFTRPGARQQPIQGLGTGCRPDTVTEVYRFNDRPITTRQQYTRLSPPDRQAFVRAIETLNSRWGYFGAPPVPNDEVVDYYFDEAPRGGWPVVRVSINRQVTSIPFYNRGQNPQFRRICTQGVGSLPSRRQTVVPPTVSP
jgi:hypothetical protein